MALGYRTNYVNGAKYDNDIDGHLICKGVELFLTKNILFLKHMLNFALFLKLLVQTYHSYPFYTPAIK